MSAEQYRFGDFTLDATSRLLTHRDSTVPLAPMAIALLLILTKNAGVLVSKRALMDALWPDGFVEEGNLTQYVHLLRRALSAGGLECAIETIPRRGYRFIAPVRCIDNTVAKSAGRAWYARPTFAALVCTAVFALAFNSAPKTGAYVGLSSESQRLYKLGRFHLNLRTEAGIRESLRNFTRVTLRDPRNPLGFSGLADAYIAVHDYPCNDEGCLDVVAAAERDARRAVVLDPWSAEAHTSLAMVLHAFKNDDANADREFARAIALNPQYALAHEWYGNSLLLRGRLEPARRELEAAIALEPTAPATYAWLARDAYFARRYGDAIHYAHEALALNPTRVETRLIMGLALEQSGDTAGAIRAFATLRRYSGDAYQARILIASTYAHSGRRGVARDDLDENSTRAAIRSGHGDDVALAWISLGAYQRALTIMRSTHLGTMRRTFLALDPRLDAVRKDPRFSRWTTI